MGFYPYAWRAALRASTRPTPACGAGLGAPHRTYHTRGVAMQRARALRAPSSAAPRAAARRRRRQRARAAAAPTNGEGAALAAALGARAFDALVGAAAAADAALRPNAAGGAPRASEGFSRFVRSPLWAALHEWARAHGPVFRLAFGPKAFLVVSDPAMAKHILATNARAYDKGFLAEFARDFMGDGLIPADNATWARRSPAVRAALHARFLDVALGVQWECAREAAAALRARAKAAADGGGEELVVDLEEFYATVALRTVARLLFNVDVGVEGGGSAAAGGENGIDGQGGLSAVLRAVTGVMQEAEHRSTFFVEYWKLPLVAALVPRQRRFQENLATLRRVLGGLVDEALAGDRAELSAEDLAARDYSSLPDVSVLRFLVDVRGEDAGAKQLLDDLMTLLIAGHETSAAVLTWGTFLLLGGGEAAGVDGSTERWWERVQAEADALVDAVDARAANTERGGADVGADGARVRAPFGVPHLEDLLRMEAARLCVAETLRLYPQPPVLIRRPLEDDVLPKGGGSGGSATGGGYDLPAGTDILLSAWSLQRSEEVWGADAAVFDPERWRRDVRARPELGWGGYDATEGAARGLIPSERASDFAFLPFGGGMRRCVGDQLGLSQVLLAQAALARELDVELVDPAGVGMRAGGSIHTAAGLMARVRARSVVPPRSPAPAGPA